MEKSARRHRWLRGLKDVEMMEWLDGTSRSDTRNNQGNDGVGSPFALLSASAYVITRIQLHAAFTIFFQACISLESFQFIFSTALPFITRTYSQSVTWAEFETRAVAGWKKDGVFGLRKAREK